ncbi:MAG TPA: LysM peptidoglycan-binding domain-containing protein, partial [Dehalococcoidia bacterium]|nr:LysM peptidoglycan-binding domain-containing protein [Dehalococcoidia bacterium]
LGVIAKRFNTTISTIRRANNIRGTTIIAGESLLIPVATSSSDHYQLSDAQRLKSTQAYVEKKLGSEPAKYTVKSGDSLWEIARDFKVSLRSLAKWNGMATTDMLHSGRELVIFSTAENVHSLAYVPTRNEIIRKVNYKVRRGESLSRIADKFNLSVTSIKKWNQKITRQKYIQPGDNITLYVDVTQTE